MPAPPQVVRELSSVDRAALERHFLALDAHDRRLRFGIAPREAGISSYVERIDFTRDAAFGIVDDDLEILGAAHLARAEPHAELGVSVVRAHRNRGLGSALLARASLRARNWGLRSLFMHCLQENTVMMHLARKHGMAIVALAGEADAWLTLAPADAASLFGEAFAQGAALFDFALKMQLAAYRRVALSDGQVGQALASPARH